MNLAVHIFCVALGGAFGALDEAERETLKALLEKLLSDWEGE